ncbi:MAG TPA: hypothetical protein VNQ32_00710 [Steroidobacteraceae bacterium]|nr:hypothetical protein [Steroidobacteraceae bacterium]
MNAITQYMEHRWGTRVELDAPAELATAEGVCTGGRVRNASLSGAFVQTTAKVTLLSRIALRPLVTGGSWLDACVVRVEPTGLALEWLEPGLHPVSALLALGRPNPPPLSHRNPKIDQVVHIFPGQHRASPAP